MAQQSVGAGASPDVLALVLPTSLTVTPANPSIQAGQTQQFVALNGGSAPPLQEVRSVAKLLRPQHFTAPSASTAQL